MNLCPDGGCGKYPDCECGRRTNDVPPERSKSEPTDTLAEALPREIARVREIQDQYKTLRGMPNVIVEPQIALMEHEIQTAIRACAEGDIAQMVRSYQSLKDYAE